MPIRCSSVLLPEPDGPVTTSASPGSIDSDAPLTEAVTRMREQDLECLPVLAGKDNPRVVGMIELRAVLRQLSQEILRRHQLADNGTV